MNKRIKRIKRIKKDSEPFFIWHLSGDLLVVGGACCLIRGAFLYGGEPAAFVLAGLMASFVGFLALKK